MKKKKAPSPFQRRLVQLLIIIGGGILGFILVLSFIPGVHSLPTVRTDRVVLSLNNNVRSLSSKEVSSISHPYKEEAFTKDTAPKISIVLLKAGLNPQITYQAMKIFPKEVSFAFMPYTPDIRYWVSQARAQGREVFFLLPLEPIGLIDKKEASYTLFANTSKEENLQKLKKILAKADNVTGVISFMGERFLVSQKDLYPILKFLKEKEYLFIESQSPQSPIAASMAKYTKTPFLNGDKFIEEDNNEEEVKKNLYALEEKAQKEGSALGLIYLNEKIFLYLQYWLQTLENKGIMLVPVTALLDKNVKTKH